MSASQQSQPGRWKPILLALVLAGLVVWWLGRQAFNWAGFWLALRALDPAWVAASCLAAILTYAGRAVRWQVLIEHARPQARFWPIFEATVIGFTFSVVLGRAGEFVRPFLIARSEGLTVGSQVAVWFLERLTDLIAVLILFGFVLTRFDLSQANRAGPEVRWILEYGGRAIGALGGVSLAILLVFRAFSAEAAARVMEGLALLPDAWRERLAGVVVAFADGVEATRQMSVLIRVGLYTILEWGLIALSFHGLLRSSPATAHLSFTDTLIVLGFVAFASVLQIPGVGGGAQVATVVVLTQLFDVAAEPATAMALLMWIVGFALVTPLGLVLSAKSGLGFRRVVRAMRGHAPARGSGQ